ncbi:glutaredoxin 3 [Amylibacter ulvae]|uniref:Glutaredoxin n=1 Tax=Paramylibacter ulvae TaxID=1651968 RepID=A0ABQ3D0X8_9RHOB|nr:glutaredoxin 3 [Amylibacter ulvae]GHA48062.1 glutaredoxin 3 [Amylibacter ulvae]
MKNVVIYTGNLCGFCSAAKNLLSNKGVNFTEINVHSNPDKRAEMMQRSNGGRTVPQIFIDDLHVGGSDDLHMLERAGKLDALLSA